MKNQNSQQIANAVAVQPSMKFPDQNRINHRRYAATKLMLFAVIIVATALPSMAAICGPNSCSDYLGRVYVNSASNPPTVYVSIVNRSLYKSLDCTPASGWYFTLLPNNPGYSQIYSLLLQARTTNTPVIIRANDYSSGCTINYVVAGQ